MKNTAGCLSLVRAVLWALLSFSLQYQAVAITHDCRWLLHHEIPELHREATISGTSVPFARAFYIHSALEARVKFVANTYSPTDLLIVEELPPEVDIPFVAAIITGSPVAELSHTALLAKRIGIPILYLPNPAENPLVHGLLADYSGEKRVLEIDAMQGVAGVRHRTPEDLHQRQIVWPDDPIDRSGHEIPSDDQLSMLNLKDLRLRAGEKSGNLIGSFPALKEENHPQVTVLQFGNYFRFLREAHLPDGQSLETYIQNLVREMKLRSSETDFIRTSLEDLCRKFDAAKFTPEHLDNILKVMLTRYGNIQREFRFRTSNPIEDSLGAGVYSSVTLKESFDLTIQERADQIEAAIKEVYKSEWSFRAYMMREFMGVDEENEAMGVLIHPSMKDEILTGVATMREIYGTKIIDLVVYPGSQSATSPTIDAIGSKLSFGIDERGSLFFKSNKGMVFEKDYSSREEFVAAIKSELTVVSFGNYQNLLDVLKPVYEFWQKETKVNPELMFEFILAKAEDAHGPTSRPVILQVKVKEPEIRVVPYVPGAHMTEPVLANFDTWPHDVELTTALGGLPQDMQIFRDFIYTAKVKEGMITNQAFFFLQVEGHKIILMMDKWRHEDAYTTISTIFRAKNIAFKVLDYGQLKFAKPVVEGDRIVLGQLMLGGSNGNDQKVFGVEKMVGNQDLLHGLMEAFQAPGHIEFRPDSRLYVTTLEGNHYVGMSIEDMQAAIKDLRIPKPD